jgi:hypothetical protein
MSSEVSWGQWNDRFSKLWPDVFNGRLAIESDADGNPVLATESVRLPLQPSHWGMGSPDDDRKGLCHALETVIQGHAPDYWRDSKDPMVQALGWLDRRMGRRSWERWCDEHRETPRSALEQQLMALRSRAEKWSNPTSSTSISRTAP